MNESRPMKKKNVLVFLNSFWNNGAGMSGGDQMFIQVFKRIRNDLGLLWCVTSPDGKAAIEKEVPGVAFKISLHGFDRLNLMVNYVIRTFFALRCLTLKPDVIYAGSDFFPDVIPAFMLKIICPRVRWIQCIFHIYPYWRSRPGSKIKSFIAQYMQVFSLLLARRADIVLNINHEVKEYLAQRDFAAERIVVIPPGIEQNEINMIPSAPVNEGYEGIFLGRLNINKGALDLIEIWARVVKEIPQARLCIIGGGDDDIVLEMQKKISDFDMKDKINISGYLENNRAFPLIKASKVFLFPSREEGFGIAIVEAMQCGLPIIGWNLPVYSEHFPQVVDAIEMEDYEAFSLRVVYWLRNAEKRNEKIQAGKRCAENFTWDATANSFYDCITRRGR